jgi:hypothetical protein
VNHKEVVDKDNNVIDEITLTAEDLFHSPFCVIRSLHADRYPDVKSYIRTYVSQNDNSEKSIGRSLVNNFMETLINELIDTGAVFVFPGNRMAMAIVQRSMNSHRYKYYVETGMGNVTLAVVVNKNFCKKFSKTYYGVLHHKSMRRLNKKLASGMKYITYEQLISMI